VKHIRLFLGGVGLERDDVARGVVEDGVDADRDGTAVDREIRAVTDVDLPEGAGVFGLPPKAGVAVGFGDALDAVEALLLKLTPEDTGADRLRGEAPFGDEGFEDELGRGLGILAANGEDQLALLGAEIACDSAVGACVGLEAIEAFSFVCVVPPLQRRDAEEARHGRARHAPTDGCEGLQLGL
jgi:hypothetical protein